jgi:hypothetical protein
VEINTVTSTVQAIPSLPIFPGDKRSPEVEDRAASAGATTSPLASSWIATYGTSRVSSACFCIIAQAASTQTVYNTRTASPQTYTQANYGSSSTIVSITKITQTTSVTSTLEVIASITVHTTVTHELDVTATEVSYMTSLSIVDVTATSDVTASTTLSTTLVTTVTVTQAAVPPTPTAFIIQASGSGTLYDGQYVFLPQGGNPFFQFTSDITSATPFDTTSAPKFNGGTFPNVLQVASRVLRFAGLSAGSVNYNTAIQQIFFYGPPNGYVFSYPGNSGRFPLQCTFARPLQYSRTMSCQMQRSYLLAAGYLSTFEISSTGFMLIVAPGYAGDPYYPATLTAIPLYS